MLSGKLVHHDGFFMCGYGFIWYTRPADTRLLPHHIRDVGALLLKLKYSSGRVHSLQHPSAANRDTLPNCTNSQSHQLLVRAGLRGTPYLYLSVRVQLYTYDSLYTECYIVYSGARASHLALRVLFNEVVDLVRGGENKHTVPLAHLTEERRNRGREEEGRHEEEGR